MFGKNNSLKKKIIAFIVSAIFVYAAVEGLKNMIKKRDEQNRTNAMLDRDFEEMNRGFPKEIAPNVTIDRIYRENKKIYLVYTSVAITSKSIDLNERAKDLKKYLIPDTCSNETNKKATLLGYSFVFVYNISDKKDAFRVEIDRSDCAKY